MVPLATSAKLLADAKGQGNTVYGGFLRRQDTVTEQFLIFVDPYGIGQSHGLSCENGHVLSQGPPVQHPCANLREGHVGGDGIRHSNRLGKTARVGHIEGIGHTVAGIHRHGRPDGNLLGSRDVGDEADGIRGDPIPVGIGNDAVELTASVRRGNGDGIRILGYNGLSETALSLIPIVPPVGQAITLRLHEDRGFLPDGGSVRNGLYGDDRAILGCRQSDCVGFDRIPVCIGDLAIELTSRVPFGHGQGIRALPDGGSGKGRLSGVSVIPLVAQIRSFS